MLTFISYLYVAALAACPDAKLIARNASCKSLCIRSGATGGSAHGRSCRCTTDVDEDFETFERGAISLGRAEPTGSSIEEPIKPVRFIWTNPGVLRSDADDSY